MSFSVQGTILMKLLCSICFLARQGLALLGDGSEEDGQLLQLISSHDPLIAGWLQKKRYRYTSHKIQDDFLDLMGKVVFFKQHFIPFATIQICYIGDR